jgi:ribosome-associated toxin RatA of RatAB toxin-antitoxin module
MHDCFRTSDGTAGGRLSVRRLVVTLMIVVAGITPASAMPQDDGSVRVNEAGGTYSVVATFTVPHAPSFAVAALTDYPNIPRFLPEVRSSTILERLDGLVVVEQEAVASFLMFSKRIHLVLEVRELQNTIRFRDRCRRSFVRYEGSWTMIEKDGRTDIRYELSAKPSFDVPALLLKRLLKRDATRMIERLRAEIAARARGVGAATYLP